MVRVLGDEDYRPEEQTDRVWAAVSTQDAKSGWAAQSTGRFDSNVKW